MSSNEYPVDQQITQNQDSNDQGLDSSIFSLTLDEIQNTLYDPDKSFGSMNVDEFLSSIWSTEEGTHPVAATIPTSIPALASTSTMLPPVQEQGSFTAPPPPLCWKTTDEVRAETHLQQPFQFTQQASKASDEATVGEMTFEDFLVKVGVVQEGSSSYTATALPLPSAQQVPQQVRVSELKVDPEEHARFTDVKLGSCSGRKETGEARGEQRRRGTLDGPMKIDQLQKRMIKNRESAARSRARKQVHAHVLLPDCYNTD